MPSHEQRLSAWAADHHEVVDTTALRTLEIPRATVRTAVRRSRLHPLHRGVWSTTLKPSFDGRCLAAVLAYGGEVRVSRRAAAALRCLRDTRVGDIELVSARDLRSRSGIRVHTCRWLDPADLMTWRGIPTTTPERILLDRAAVLADDPLGRMVDAALQQDLLDPERVAALLDRAVGTRGVSVLRGALGLDLTRSGLEQRFVRFVRRLRLPAPECDVVEGYECDCWWPEQRLAVELDSWRFHRGRRVFERDHDRDLDLGIAGIRMLRFTYRQLTGRSADVGARLRLELG